MTEQSEQALPFSEAAREAAAFDVYADLYKHGDKARQAARTHWQMMTDASREPCYAKADRILAAAVDADPRLKAFLRLAALSDEEVVEEVVERVAVALRVEGAALAPMRHYRRQARVVLAALGLPVAEQETP